MKDAVGNKLAKGQLLQVALPGGLTVRGRVKEIRDGGLVAVGGSRKREDALTPGIVTVESEFQLESDPRDGVCPNVVRLYDPSGKDLEAENRTLPRA